MAGPSDNWESIARQEPYYGVLTSDRYLGASGDAARLAEFFASGERDAAHLLSLAVTAAGVSFAPRRILDYGCGVGRLTLALAKRCETIVGIDAAPTMIELAKQQAKDAGVVNATFLRADDLETLQDESFDLIVSLIVFQHIPIAAGMASAARLLGKLKTGGVAALHFSTRRPGGNLRRLGRRLRSRSPLLHRILQTIRREQPRLPYMEMNEYSLDALVRLFREAGCAVSLIEATTHGDVAGAIIVATKS